MNPRYLIPLVILAFGASRGIQRILTGLALVTVDAWTVTAASLILATLVWVPIALRAGWFRAERELWTRSILLGIVNIVVPGIAFTAAQLFITASATALLVATLPLVIAVFAAVLLKERITRPMYAGLVLGTGGVLALILGKGGALAADNWWLGASLTAIGVASAAAVYVGWRPLLAKHSATVLLGPQLIVSAVVATIAALVFGSPQSADAVMKPGILFVLAALAIVNYVIPQLAMFWLLTRTTAVRSAIANYLAPLFAAILGTVFLAQPLTWTIVVAGLLIIAGAAGLNYARNHVRLSAK